MKPYIKIFLVLLFISDCVLTNAQTNNPIQVLEQGRKTSIRGMSVVTDKIVWVSGSGGSVGKSVDGGKTFNWITVKGYEKRDFRDIEAYNQNTAIIMAVAELFVI